MKTIEIENTVQRQAYDEDLQQVINRPLEEVQAEEQAEEQALIDAKIAEVQAEIDAYQAEINRQLTEGGRGPRGTFQAIEIVKVHQGQFEVVFKSNE
jgi:hypothetical protein